MECGTCTLCCDRFPVKWLSKPANTICKHCDSGCKIHNSKPVECTDFNCAYAQMKVAFEELRPDKSGVIFEKITDELFLGTYDPKEKKQSIVANQITAFHRQGYSVVMVSIFGGDNLELLLGKGHEFDKISQTFNKYLAERYGSSNL